MKPLTQVLQCLKRPSKSWSLFISPDPRRFHGFKRLGSVGVVGEFNMKLRSGVVDLDECFAKNPLLAITPNTQVGSSRATESKDSKWVKILDTGVRNPKGQDVREVLVDMLDKFPSYELQSERGTDAAIRDVEDRLSGIASFEGEGETATVNPRPAA